MSTPAWLAARFESPPAAAATASPATAVTTSASASLLVSTRLRSGSAVSVRCSVPALNSSVATQTPNTAAASIVTRPTAVFGIVTYMLGSSGETISRTAPTITTVAATTAAVQRGVGR